jgi:hypothetical protein
MACRARSTACSSRPITTTETTTETTQPPSPAPAPTPAPEPVKPDASATPSGDVEVETPPAPPGWTAGAWREHHALRQRAQAAEVAKAAAEAKLAAFQADTQAQLSAARRAAEEAAAFARTEALHPVVADPEVRDELRQAYDRYAKREGDKAAPVGVWLAEHAPKSKLYGHLFAASAPAAAPVTPAAPPTPKTDPNAGAQNSEAAPGSSRMTLTAFRAIKSPTEADYRKLQEATGLRLSDAMIKAMSKGR